MNSESLFAEFLTASVRPLLRYLLVKFNPWMSNGVFFKPGTAS